LLRIHLVAIEEVPMPNVTPHAPRPQLPTPRGPDRWNTIRYALKSWAGTFRLCLILLVMGIPPAAVALMLALRP
jgi:hypothetical protein